MCIKTVLTGWRKTSQESDPWKSISQSHWIQRSDFKLMSSLRLPLLPKLIFPLALSAAERPKLDRALGERQLSSRLSEQTLHFYPYLWANIHTDRQANTCVCKHNSKGERQSSPWHPQAALPENFFQFKLHSLICFAAYSCRLCMCCLTDIRVCLSGESVQGCLFTGIPVFGLYSWGADTLSDITNQCFN